MSLLFLDTLKAISGYSDVRSIRKWLHGMNLILVRVGRNYATDEAALGTAISRKQRITKKPTTYHPVHETEKSFLSEVELLLSEKTEL